MKNLLLMLAVIASLGNLYAQNERKCAGPMEDFLFRKALAGFSLMNPTAMNKAARTFTASHCLSTNQTRRLAALYRNEADRLDYACYASSFVLDLENYASLESLFSDPATKQQFFNCIGFLPAPPSPVPGYTGRIGCGRPIHPAEFAEMKSILNGYHNSIIRLDVAKQMVARTCVTTQQVRELSMLFSNQISRKEFMEFAYFYTHDIDNYYKLQDILSNSISRREFVDFCYAH